MAVANEVLKRKNSLRRMAVRVGGNLNRQGAGATVSRMLNVEFWILDEAKRGVAEGGEEDAEKRMMGFEFLTPDP